MKNFSCSTLYYSSDEDFYCFFNDGEKKTLVPFEKFSYFVMDLNNMDNLLSMKYLMEGSILNNMRVFSE